MSVQLFAKSAGSSSYQLLDLFTAEPIKLTLSVANIVDPLAANSIFSRTFRVPHTANNGPFFKAAFNVNSTSFDASLKADAYINDNGVFFSVGNIRLSAIYVNEKTNNIEYEINYYGETSDFGSKIGGGFLSEVNLSQYNHSLSSTTVINSWSGGLLGGNVVYPMIEWGYTYSNGQPSQGTLSRYQSGVSNRGVIAPSASANTSLTPSQFKPTLKAKALWDAIFNETGYTYTSNFLETDPLFTNLFVIAENEARSSINDDLKFQANDSGANNELGCNGSTSFTSPSKFLDFPNEINDPSNSYSPSTSTYTSAASGTCTFSITGYADGNYINSSTSTSILFQIVDVNTNAVLASTSPQQVNYSTQAFTKSLTCFLNIGQQVRMKAINIGLTGYNADFVWLFSCTYELTNAPNLVSMSSFMPTNIRKIDFMRSIINRFRLVFVPSRDNEKQFEIIPWKDWVLLGDQRDWTSKLDGTKDLKITPLFYSQDRLQVFKDQEDADFVNYNYQLDYKQTYGQKNLDSNNELIKGTKEYKDQFAPLPLWPIGNVEPEITPGTPNPLYGFVIPHLAKDTDKERQPIQPKLRLAYYNGLQSVPTVPAGYQQGFYMMVGATPTLFSSYPLMSQYSTWPVTSTTFDLAWENEQALYNLEQSGLNGNLTSYDCYNVFWKTWYDTTFDPFSRIVEANFVLGYDDIIDLKFNDYIFVKDSWYFVNKITDYVIGTETNCRVELIKVGNNIGLVIPPTVELKTMVELCFSNATACDAYCCNTGNVQVGQYFMNSLDFSTATELYLDVLGQVPAPSGYYSDGTITYFVDGGVMIFAANTAGCFCTPPTLVQYTACPGADSCEACCCTNEEVTVYGTGSTLAGSLNVYFDSGGTLPATGWYKATGEIYSVYVVNGVTQQVSNCDLCNCSPITIYEYEVTFSDESPCDACCIGTPITIWTDADTFVNSTVVYIDNVPLTLSGAAWYQLNGDILVVDASGNVTAIGTCSVCTCLNYYRAENCNTPGLYADFSYATSLSVGEVVSSLDYPGECWTIVDTATAGTPIHEVFTSCAECLPPVTCNCVNYNVKSLLGGAIGYVDCADQEVYYIDIPAGFDQDLCACEDSLVVLAGKVKWQADGLCDVAGSELVVSGIFRSIDGHQTNQAALLDANGNVQTTFSTFDTIGQNGFSPDTAPIYGVLKQDDSIWFAGQFTSYQNQIALGLLKVDYTGAVDPSYDPQFNGFPVGQYPYDIQKFSDGSLVLSGLFTDYDSEGTGSATANRIVCIQQDGSLDPTFVSGTGFNQTINKAIIKNDIWYGAAWTTNLVTYKNSSGSRFVAINRNGDRITNYGIASTNIPTNFNFDVDDLGRVYIAYEYEDAIYVERWLPSGAKDPSYTFSWVSPTPLYAFPYIYINNNYECFVSIQETNGLNVNILKVNASGQLDATFGVRQVTSSAAGYSQVIGIDQVGVFISNYLTLGGEEIAYTYDGILTGAITKVDQTTGYIIGSFNQIDFTPTADINRYIDRISV